MFKGPIGEAKVVFQLSLMESISVREIEYSPTEIAHETPMDTLINTTMLLAG